MVNDGKALVITTFNREESFKKLYDSLPFDRLDLVIVVNGGEPYKGDYTSNEKIYWVQHKTLCNIAKSRNDGLKVAYQLGYEHIFLSEDDMLIKDETICDEYIHASKVTGLKYLCFTSYAWECGPVGARTPRLTTEYKDSEGRIISIKFYKNMCNEFTYRHISLLDQVGFYDEDYKSVFDVDWVYRASKHLNVSNFWYFADIGNSDDLIQNNDDVSSQIDPDGARWKTLGDDYAVFQKMHGHGIGDIPIVSQETQTDKLKSIMTK